MRTVITYIVSKKELFISFLILIAILGLLAFTLLSDKGQTLYTAGSGSLIKISGTSNLQKWNLQATNFTADATFIIKNGQVQALQTLLMVLPVANLIGSEDLLTTEAQKALKSGKYRNISFKLSNATAIPDHKIIKATGNLTIAGVTKQITLITYYIINANESITCIGRQQIKLSDYNIKALNYMMGAKKPDNVVDIDIILEMDKSQLLSKN